MESRDSKLPISLEQTQCRPSKLLLQPSSFLSLPPDQDLILLLSHPRSSGPFLVLDNDVVMKENSSHEHPSYKIREKILSYNRKQKSLEELSKKFLNRFEGKNKRYLELDKVTKELGVERRRIYDIINILESLKVVTKKGKNNYRWKGLKEAVKTIEECQKSPNSIQIRKEKKEKSLQFLAHNFLKLILKKTNLSLEEASKEIIKDTDKDVQRTKVRRLYDIVNVFKSLRLVKKITLSKKKPGFKWLGVENLIKFIEEKNEEGDKENITNMDLETTTKSIKVKEIPQFSSSFFCNFIEEKIGFNNIDCLSQIFKQNLFTQTSSRLSSPSKLQKYERLQQMEGEEQNNPLKENQRCMNQGAFCLY